MMNKKGLENSFEKKMLHIICELCFTISGSDKRKLAKIETTPRVPSKYQQQTY